MIGKNISDLQRAIRTMFTFMAFILLMAPLSAQTQENVPTRLPFNPNRIPPNYPIRYGAATIESIQEILNRIHGYLEGRTPCRLVNSRTNEPVTDISKPAAGVVIEGGDFPIISYEWGVTYSGMILASEATGDRRFADYAAKRLNFLADLFPVYRAQFEADPMSWNPIYSIVNPRSLDDSGSMCASMIKAKRAGAATNVQPLIDNYIRYIREGQSRLEDGTLMRNRPFPASLWLDDLYMSVPALAQMGKATGESRYYDDAARQIIQFADRMFIKEKGLYMHGWVQGMDVKPVFHWARANGWAIMAKVELLDVLPEDHPDRDRILNLLRYHIRGLANCQSGQGLWHQLLDRNDSYLETSASAMFAFCIARAINRGWISRDAHLPMLRVAWNAVAGRVNVQGQVEGTCIGTGMGFDPMFYYYRPASPLAAHGYGSVLHAGAEMIHLLKKR